MLLTFTLTIGLPGMRALHEVLELSHGLHAPLGGHIVVLDLFIIVVLNCRFSPGYLMLLIDFIVIVAGLEHVSRAKHLDERVRLLLLLVFERKCVVCECCAPLHPSILSLRVIQGSLKIGRYVLCVGGSLQTKLFIYITISDIIHR